MVQSLAAPLCMANILGQDASTKSLIESTYKEKCACMYGCKGKLYKVL